MGDGSARSYRAFDLRWCSEGLAIPELPEAAPDPWGPGDSEVWLGPEPPTHWPALPVGRHDTRVVTMAPADVRLTLEGIGRVRISGGNRIAWSREHSGVGDQDLRSYLLGPAVAALLIQRGMLLLHGNALERDGQAIVCLGHAGAGKSTLAYVLMEQGWRVLADDLVVITPDGLVLPGIPRIKLWQDAADALGISTAGLPAIRQGVAKFQLLGEAVKRADEPVPLRALYLIRREMAAGSSPQTAGICRISSQKLAGMHLCQHTPWPRLVRGLGQEGQVFLAAAGLLRRTPLATLHLPAGIPAMRTWLMTQELVTGAGAAVPGSEADPKCCVQE